MTKKALIPLSEFSFLKPIELKREFFLFDKIILDRELLAKAEGLFSKLKHSTQSEKKDTFLNNISNMEYLHRRGLIEFRDVDRTVMSFANNKENYKDNLDNFVSTELNKIVQEVRVIENKTTFNVTVSDLNLIHERSIDFTIRLYSLIQLSMGENDLFPLYQYTDNLFSAHRLNKSEIIQIVFKKIPVPQKNLSWDEVIEFKNDVNIKSKYFALINWVNNISKENLSLSEFEDKLNYLYYDYLSNVKRTKIKYDLSVIQLLLNSTAYTVENLIRLKFSNITNSLFQFTKQKVSLLEFEANLPNREIAYIHEIEKKIIN